MKAFRLWLASDQRRRDALHISQQIRALGKRPAAPYVTAPAHFAQAG